MRLYYVYFIIFVLLCNCGKKEKKVKIKEENFSNIISTIYTEEINESQKLNPEKFFKISSEINKLTREYDKIIQASSTEDADKLIAELGRKINMIYKRYGITEEEFNQYSSAHYKKLEKYLEAHPEIEEKLRK